MKRKFKTKSNLYTFLKSKGVLEKGIHEEIQSARKEYWNKYKRQWRNDKRKKEKEFTISLDRTELKELSIEAKRHKLSRTRFIKTACFAYINNSFVVPDSLEVKRISQLLAMTYNSIQEMVGENKLEFNTGRNMMESIQKLEREILPVLHNPKSLEEFIKEHISECPENRLKLIDFINSL